MLCRHCGAVLALKRMADSKITDPKDSGWRRMHPSKAQAMGCLELQEARKAYYYPERQGTWAPAKDGTLEWQTR